MLCGGAQASDIYFLTVLKAESLEQGVSTVKLLWGVLPGMQAGFSLYLSFFFPEGLEHILSFSLPFSTTSYISDKPVVSGLFSYLTPKTASHKLYLYMPSNRSLYLQAKSYFVAQGPEHAILPLQLPQLSLLACTWLKHWMFHISFRDSWACDKVSNILE